MGVDFSGVVADPVMTSGAGAGLPRRFAVIEQRDNPVDDGVALTTIQCCGNMAGIFTGTNHTVVATLASA